MYDLLLRNAQVIDPSLGIDRQCDVAFEGGVVSAIEDSIDGEAKQEEDLEGLILTPGLIDLHTHVYWGGTSIGVDPDELGEQSACTTLVDAGTAGPANLLGMRKHIIEESRTRVLAYINVSFAGIFAFSRDVMVGECSDMRLLDPRICCEVAQEHEDIVVGVKVRVGRTAGGPNGIGPLEVALEVAEKLGLPLMAHLDHPPPSRRAVFELLRPGDIITHCFRPFPNAPVKPEGGIYPEVVDARERGIIFDVGHGMGSFGFTTARAMLENNFLPDVISSDSHSLSIGGPAHDLLMTLSKFLCLGLSLEQVIKAATLAPARAIRRYRLGTLRVGQGSDASVLELRQGEYDFVDAMGDTVRGTQRLFAKARVINGRWRALEL